MPAIENPSNFGMSLDEFRECTSVAVEWLIKYYESVAELPTVSAMAPHEITRKIPNSAPTEGERFERIMKDMDDVVVPGPHALAIPPLLRLLSQ